MGLRAENQLTVTQAAGDSDSLSAALAASCAYLKAIDALHDLGRTLEALAEEGHDTAAHAIAARKDADHQHALYQAAKDASRAAVQLKQRADRHMVRLLKGVAVND